MKNVETIEKWNILSSAMLEKGYRLWQMQYSWDNPEGYHAWFWLQGKPDVEVVTHNKEVQDAILGDYGGRKLK